MWQTSLSRILYEGGVVVMCCLLCFVQGLVMWQQELGVVSKHKEIMKNVSLCYTLPSPHCVHLSLYCW
jgi:hypothetical protein